MTDTKRQTAHTPGPWKRRPYLNSNNLSLTVGAGEGADWTEIGTVTGGCGDDAVYEANADLFASAPDMLAMLVRAAAIIDSDEVMATSDAACAARVEWMADAKRLGIGREKRA